MISVSLKNLSNEDMKADGERSDDFQIYCRFKDLFCKEFKETLQANL